jgi:hypothetical protein
MLSCPVPDRDAPKIERLGEDHLSASIGQRRLADPKLDEIPKNGHDDS